MSDYYKILPNIGWVGMGGNIPRPAGTPFTSTALSAGKGGIKNEEILLGHDKIISEVTENKNWMGTSITPVQKLEKDSN